MYPIVSVIVSSYKSERFMEGCLNDLVNQTFFEHMEIIVIDSASPECEGVIVREYQELYPGKIKYLRTEEREGLYTAWNRAIRIAKGKYLTNANTDDRHSPDAIEKLTVVLEQNPDAMLAYSHCKVSQVPNLTFFDCPGDRIYQYPEYFPPLCLLHYCFGPQPLWRREVHNDIGMFDSNLFAVGDLDFNIRFCLNGYKAILLPEVLGVFFYGKNSITNSFTNQSQEKAQVLAKYRQPENVTALYGVAGWNVDSDYDKAVALNDFSIRAMSFTIPWGKNRDSAPQLALSCLNAAQRLLPESNIIKENLKIAKSTGLSVARMESNAKAMKRINEKRDQKSSKTQSYFQEQLNRSQPKINMHNIDAPPVISFFAGANDHFHFAKPLIANLKSQGIQVRIVTTADVQKYGLHHHLCGSSLAWFEWGNGHIVEASHLPKICPIICRVHRFEVFEHRMAQVKWDNIDAVVFVNRKFLGVFQQVFGIDLTKHTSVHEIPNPLVDSKTYHDRVPGFNIACVSRFHADKNPLLALYILSALVEKDSRYKLYMLGKIQDVQLFISCLDFVSKAGLKKNFIYEGTTDDVEKWLLDKSVILSTSNVESQGMALLEAMRQGIKPVIYNGYGMENTFPSNCMFYSIKDAVKMIMSKDYTSKIYREVALKKFGEKEIMPKMNHLIHALIEKYENNFRFKTIPTHRNEVNQTHVPPVKMLRNCLININ